MVRYGIDVRARVVEASEPRNHRTVRSCRANSDTGDLVMCAFCHVYLNASRTQSLIPLAKLKEFLKNLVLEFKTENESDFESINSGGT